MKFNYYVNGKINITLIKENAVITFCMVLIFILSGCTPNNPINKDVSDSHFYNLFKTSVVYIPNGNWFESRSDAIKGADVDTFRPLNSYYGVDKKHVYYQWDVVKSESPNDFKLLDGNYVVGKKVYLRNIIIPDADVKTFSTVKYVENVGQKGFYFFAKDKAFVFAGRDKISNEPANFKYLGEGRYFYDSRDVYDVHFRKKLGADPLTFSFLFKQDDSPSVYAKDKNHVFYLNARNSILPLADKDTFIALCSGNGPPYYAKDKNQYYYFDDILPEVDDKNFSCDMNPKMLKFNRNNNNLKR